MKKRIMAKLLSQAGESIAETLVATLIAALALLMLAGAVSSAARMVNSSKAAVTEYYNSNWTADEPGASSLVTALQDSLPSGS